MKAKYCLAYLLCGLSGSALTFGSASAQTGAVVLSKEQSAQVDDIVVTARKSAETVQSVPVSITALSGETMQAKGIAQVSDMQYQTPSLSITQAVQGPSSIVVTLRGLTTQNFRLTVDSTIGLYVDGVYMPHGYGGSVGEFVDLDRIEVLRGPQGTLYGRSTTGGAVAIYSKAATPDALEGFVRGRVAENHTLGLQAGINIPLSSVAAFRIAGEHHEHGPYGVNVFNNQPLGKDKGESVRASLMLEPSDWLKITVRGDYATEKSIPNASRAGLIGTYGPPGTVLPFGGTVAASGVNEIARALGIASPISAADLARIYAAYMNSAPADVDDGNMDVQPHEEAKMAGVSLTLDFDFGAASLRSITGYRYYHRTGELDLDGSPFSMVSYRNLKTRDEQISQEFTLTGSTFDDRLKYVFGAFYSREYGTDFYDTRSFALLSPGGFSIQDGDIVNESLGLYAQATYSLTDALRVTGGLRWSHDKRELTTRNRSNTACTALGVTLASLAGAPCTADKSAAFSQISYTIGLDYQIAPDIMVFVKHDRGYRSGGVPYDAGSALSPSSAAGTYTAFKPEIVMNYEGGIKADLFDRHLRVNLTYFHNDFSNVQNQIGQPRPDGVPGQITKVGNDSRAKIDGVEGEMRIIPIRGIELGGHFGYLHSRYTYFLTGPVGVSTTQNFTGYPLVLAPKWAYGLSGAFTAPLGSAEIRGNLDYSWETRTLANNGPNYRPAHEVLNGRLTVALPEHGLEFSLYGKNITNDRYIIQPSGAYSSLGFVFNGLINKPRELGAEIGFKF